MSLLYDNVQDVAQTHVLIIGVGAYDYLPGGSDPQKQQYFSAQSLGQLTTSILSARAFYDTVMELGRKKTAGERAGSWAKPLGSVEVLASQAPGTDPVFGQPVDQATRSNIVQAYGNWKNRCSTRADNVAIFYFCGHGLDKGEHFLLAQDFGKVPFNPWEGSFAFDMTRRAFFGCKADTQLFFVDACRQLTSDMILMDVPLNPIEPPSLRARDCRFNLTQKAAAANENAYGPKDGVAFYTQALIGALTGNASNNDDSQWRVNTGTLAAKMNSFLQHVAPAEGYAQRCISTTSDVVDIVHFEHPPVVPVTIGCLPDNALALAHLAYENLQTNQEQVRVPEAMPWKVNVEAGVYRLKATFSGGEYQPASVVKPITPPFFNQQLTCNQ